MMLIRKMKNAWLACVCLNLSWDNNPPHGHEFVCNLTNISHSCLVPFLRLPHCLRAPTLYVLLLSHDPHIRPSSSPRVFYCSCPFIIHCKPHLTTDYGLHKLSPAFRAQPLCCSSALSLLRCPRLECAALLSQEVLHARLRIAQASSEPSHLCEPVQEKGHGWC